MHTWVVLSAADLDDGVQESGGVLRPPPARGRSTVTR